MTASVWRRGLSHYNLPTDTFFIRLVWFLLTKSLLPHLFSVTRYTACLAGSYQRLLRSPGGQRWTPATRAVHVKLWTPHPPSFTSPSSVLERRPSFGRPCTALRAMCLMGSFSVSHCRRRNEFNLADPSPVAEDLLSRQPAQWVLQVIRASQGRGALSRGAFAQAPTPLSIPPILSPYSTPPSEASGRLWSVVRPQDDSQPLTCHGEGALYRSKGHCLTQSQRGFHLARSWHLMEAKPIPAKHWLQNGHWTWLHSERAVCLFIYLSIYLFTYLFFA